MASRSPRDLAIFYGFALDSEIRQGENDNHWLIFHSHRLILQIYYPSRDQNLSQQTRRLALCFKSQSSLDPLSKINEWSLRLVSMGAEIVEDAKQESFGTELWMADPEGNEFLILVPIASEKKS